MIRATVRVAHKKHYCDTCDCPGRIKPGEHYREVVISPGDEIRPSPRWQRMTECGGCATRYGRGDLVDPG